jgi:hypothetical protein
MLNKMREMIESLFESSVVEKRLYLSEKFMKNTNSIPNDDMQPEYDLEGKKGVRGKYYRAMQQGYTVRITNEDGSETLQHFEPKEAAVILDPDVRAYFPDSESVNRTLRSLIALIPDKKSRQTAEKRAKYDK